MKALAPIGVVALLLLASASAGARPLPTGGWRSPPPRPAPHHHGSKHRFGRFPILVIEREPTVIIEREVVRELAAAPEPPPPPPPAPPREPHVLGKSYGSLPGGCMKLIEDGASYYLCSGEWYRQVGSGYRAVRGP